MANRFTRLLDFASNELGSQNAFALNELMELQVVHSDWAIEQYSIDDILKKHGISKKEWDEVCQRASKWYGGYSVQSYSVNKEIQAHIKKVIGYLPAQVLWSKSVFSGQLSSLFRKGKNGRIQRFKGNDGLFRYYIKEKML